MSAISAYGKSNSSSATKLPAGACDCHVHVFGQQTEFPMSADRSYTPGPASWKDLKSHLRSLDLQHVVIVQPSVYGTNNSCTLDAVQKLGSMARAVAVIGKGHSSAVLQEYHRGGVRGIRLNLLASQQSDFVTIRNDFLFAQATAAAMGWHVQIFSSLEIIDLLKRDITGSPVPVVVDHFGMINLSKGLEQPGFKTLLDLAASGVAYIKLSAPYLISDRDTQAVMANVVKQIARVNSERTLWGSNWPHPRGGTGGSSVSEISQFRRIDDSSALVQLEKWLEDDTHFKLTLTDNAIRLFGF